MGALSAFGMVIAIILLLFVISIVVMVGIFVYGKIVETGQLVNTSVDIGYLQSALNIIPIALGLVIIALFIYLVTGEIKEWITEERSVW